MTAIHYPDLTATSPGGRVRLEVRSPDNDPLNPRPREEAGDRSRRVWGGFQSDFVYSVWRTDAHDLLWQRRQEKEEPSPRAAWVDDDGRAVVATIHPFGAGLLVTDARGTVRLNIDLGRVLTNREINPTSAGPMWERGAHGYTLSLAGRPHWCVRLVNGRRLLVDLDSPAMTDPAPHADACAIAESAWAMARLQTFTPLLPTWERLERPWSDSRVRDGMDELHVAAHLAGALRVRPAEPVLRRLEHSVLERSYTFERLPPTPEAPDGAIEVAHLPFRQVAQLSLRRLSVEPEGLSSSVLRARRPWRVPRHTTDDDDGEDGRFPEAIALPQSLPDRAERINRVTVGTPAWEVLHSLGVPDFMTRRGWDYDLGVTAPDAVTVRLTIFDDDASTVAAIEHVRPPAWAAYGRRDDWLF